MSWRRATCRCCGDDCELTSVAADCTIIGTGETCEDGCGGIKVTFGTPDKVAGRTVVNDSDAYPEGGGLYRWDAGTELSIQIGTGLIECDSTEFYFNSMTVRWGCPSDPENYNVETFESGYALITLPTGCSDCEIRITAHYSDHPSLTIACGSCTLFPDFPLTVDIDAPWAFAVGSHGGSANCSDEREGKSLEDYGRECLDAILPDIPLTQRLGWSCGSPDRFSFFIPSDGSGGVPFSSNQVCYNISNPFPGELFYVNAVVSLGVSIGVILDPSYYASGVLYGRILVGGGGSANYAVAWFPAGTLLKTCAWQSYEGGGSAYYPPTFGTDAELGTFTPGDSNSFCLAVLQAIRDHSPYVVPGSDYAPGIPSVTVTVR